MQGSKRIAKNTAILYFRMFLMTLIGLYMYRVILQTMGVTDYGIYTAVGGFVAMFMLLSGMLTNAVNRFLTFELGRGDKERLNRVFCMSLNIMIMLSAAVLILGATAGAWFLNCKMNIPEGRMGAANAVLACSLLTFALNIVSVPYNAAIVAHEKMSAFAYISLFEATAELLIAFSLKISPFDRLITYAVLLMLLKLSVRMLYGIYCKRHFAECSYRLMHDKTLLKEMLSFAGWNFLGAGARLINTQGVNVLMNLFFGVGINAARGIAVQVNALADRFVSNFMMAMNPQITKSYAQGDINYMHRLICSGAKFSFFLVLFLLVPLCLEAHQVLSLWLGVVPDYAAAFVRLTLVATAIDALSKTLITGLHASGRLKHYMIVVGTVEFSNFPLTYAAFKLGASPLVSYYIFLIVYFILMFLRLYLIKDLIHLKASRFIKEVFLRVLIVAAGSGIFPVLVRMTMEENLLRLLTVSVVSVVSACLCIYFLGLNADERRMLAGFVRKRLHH